MGKNISLEMRFPGGKKKALTFSYDDGTVHDRKLVALLNRYGVKGTFNLNSGVFSAKEELDADGVTTDFSKVDAEEVKELYAGHEVASHTLTHPAITNLPPNMAAAEVLKDRKNLEELTGNLVRGFAYPFGAYNEMSEEILEACGIEYARTVLSTNAFFLPQDFLEWHPTCHHDAENLMELLQEFCKGERQYEPWVFYLWGHSYEFAGKDNWQVLEKFLDYVKNYEEEIWFASNMEIVDYVKAYRALRRSTDGTILYNPSGITLWIETEGTVRKVQGNETISI